MKRSAFFILPIAVLFGVAILSGCSSSRTSTVTGWEYNTPEFGGFEFQKDFQGQETGPGLVMIEGGVFTMGRTEQDIMYDWNNVPREVTVDAFYIDETEVRNIDYREYLYWLVRVFGNDYPQVYKKALPDTLVWRRKLAYNEPYVEYYFRHPAYRDYPVVGITWVQADAFCTWRTDRVNEGILISRGIFDVGTIANQTNEENFNTEAYYAGQYQGMVKKNLPDPAHPDSEGRPVRLEDGIMLPKYDLPTEAQWEYAAVGLVGNTFDERIFERKLYPWNGHYLRNDEKEFRGQFRANFQRGKGDMMGVAGSLNDAASITAPVDAYWPNDYGLYNMAGNVSEWVRDVYRPMTSVDMDEYNPFRGNVFKTKLTDEEGALAEKDSLGHLRYREVTVAENEGRPNYNRADNINYLDGDAESSIGTEEDWLKGPEQDKGSNRMYYTGKGEGRKATGISSLISDKARIYKGGGWRDKAYWLNPATRRFMDENLCRDDLGFRCAMIRVGSPLGNGKN